jgi:hypothetical protein
VRSSLRHAAVLCAAIALSFSAAAQEMAEKETTVYVHTVKGTQPRSLEEIKSWGPVTSLFKMEQSGFAMVGKAPDDVVGRDKITAHFDPLHRKYQDARISQSCLTLLEGKSYSADHVLGYNIVAIGPRKEEATQVIRREIEQRNRRPDLALTYTTCPPGTSIVTPQAPDTPKESRVKQQADTLSIK